MKWLCQTCRYVSGIGLVLGVQLGVKACCPHCHSEMTAVAGATRVKH